MTPKLTLIERPPIVAVLGHVDHGKSTLLDHIRKTNIVAKEFGGITQHVGAYEVEHKGKKITFIDTPGHAAFKSIRARGANVADIAILVVAADDGVKAQTLEALESIKSANTPFIVAINKIDKPNASIERTQASLMEKGVYLEGLGGDISWAPISAKAGTGIEDLLDLILLSAEVLELKADSSVPAEGYVIEAHRDVKRGIAATIIIRSGTIEQGQSVLAGSAIAPVRIMEDHLGKTLKSATFSTPVTIIGFDELPAAGADVRVFAKKKDAEIAQAEMHTAQKSTFDNTVNAETTGFVLPVIVRADTTGSLDAIFFEVGKIQSPKGSVRLVQQSIGDISEFDINAALASGTVPAIVVGFNVGIERVAESFAIERGVKVEKFNIIYKLTERLEELLEELAPKLTSEVVTGSAKILKTFSRIRDEQLIGCKMESGELLKNAQVRFTRHGEKVGTGKIFTLQQNRATVDKVQDGEFGTMIITEANIAGGDLVETIKKITS